MSRPAAGLLGNFTRGALLALLALLAGCAAQMAYREGQDLVTTGRVPEGLAKLEEANRLDPGSAQYRSAVLQTRERYANALTDRAETQRRQGQYAAAEQNYKNILAVLPTNDRALAGLRALDQQRRTDGWLQEAQSAIAAKNPEAARTKLRAILLEQPQQEDARALLQKIEEAAAAPPSQTALAAAYRKPITIEFKDAALRSVFEVISRTSGLNFLFDKDVRGEQKTSIFLRNSTIEAAVNLTLLTNQLEQRVLDANTILVYPNTQAKQRDYQPLNVKSFYLANAEAKTVAATLKSLLKTRDVVVDDKLNLLIVRDSPEALRLAEKLVALHDVPEPEVMLEVEILEVKRTRLMDLGIRWPDTLSLAPLASTSGGALTLADLRGLNRRGIAASVSPLTITAKKADTDANLLANPRIRARNREKAKILIGERVPNITATSTSTGFVAESVNYVDVGLKLEVEPTVYLDGEVAIKVALEVSSIINQLQTKQGSVAYQIGTRTAQTVLRLKDGENQVLAGLINDEDRRTANKVPGLGEVPVVGRLFGGQLDDASKTEIVLSITPRVLRNVRRPEAELLEFDSGTESSLGARAGAGGGGPTTGAAAPAGGTGTAASPAPPAGAVPGSASPLTATPGAPPPLVSAPTSGGGSPQGPSQGQPQGPSQGPSPAASDLVAAAAPTDVSTPPAAAAGPAALRLQGPSQARVGETFAVQVVMQSDQPVVSVPLAIGFDARLLQVTGVQEGDFLRQGGSQASFASRIDPGGQILMTGTRSAGSAGGGDAGASATGVLATVNFRVVAAAAPETRVQVLTAAPVGAGGRSVMASPAAPLVMVIGN